MKIIHINAARTGSTGRTASDLKKYHLLHGDEYRIAYPIPDSDPQSEDILIGERFDHKIHALFSRIFGLQGYFSYFSTIRFLKWLKAYHPDLVVLGNLHANYINLPLLFRYLIGEQIPVVMILHDCWLFTGKCTHFTARGCEKWKTQCSYCPALKSDNKSWFFDFSSKMFCDRKEWYMRLNSHTVVSVSEWEKNIAMQSPLFEKSDVTRIYNWVDTDVFKPASIEQMQNILQKYHLPKDTKYLISVSAGWIPNNSRTQDAIQLANILPDGYRLIVVGRAEYGIFPDNVVNIPHTSDQVELAALYSLSVAYIHFSVEDTFGKVIAEAMSCGTVPIVFDSTACAETAGPHGIAVSPHNVKAIIDSLDMASVQDRRKAVRDYANAHYCKSTNLLKYNQLFKSIIG